MRKIVEGVDTVLFETPPGEKVLFAFRGPRSSWDDPAQGMPVEVTTRTVIHRAHDLSTDMSILTETRQTPQTKNIDYRVLWAEARSRHGETDPITLYRLTHLAAIINEKAFKPVFESYRQLYIGDISQGCDEPFVLYVNFGREHENVRIFRGMADFRKVGLYRIARQCRIADGEKNDSGKFEFVSNMPDGNSILNATLCKLTGEYPSTFFIRRIEYDKIATEGKVIGLDQFYDIAKKVPSGEELEKAVQGLNQAGFVIKTRGIEEEVRRGSLELTPVTKELLAEQNRRHTIKGALLSRIRDLGIKV